MDTDSGYYTAESSDTPTGGSDAPSPEPREDVKGENTALLPKSFFPDDSLEVGKECKIKVEEIYGDSDEVLVSYVKHEESEKPEMDKSMERMDELVSEPEE